MTEKKSHFDELKELEIARMKAETYQKLIQEGFPVRVALKMSGMFDGLTTEECMALVESMCKKRTPAPVVVQCGCNCRCCSGFCARRSAPYVQQVQYTCTTTPLWVPTTSSGGSITTLIYK